jgi:hypothetical protein
VASSKVILMVMDSRSFQIIMSMTANGSRGSNTEKECSSRHHLVKLKEDFTKRTKSNKSLKLLRKVSEYYRSRKKAIKSRVCLTNLQI